MRDMKKLSEKAREYKERNNPCLEEEGLSLKCLVKNNYDHDSCSDYFLNVQTCREFWASIRRIRRIQGIRPELPHPNERLQIKEEYLKSKIKSEK